VILATEPDLQIEPFLEEIFKQTENADMRDKLWDAALSTFFVCVSGAALCSMFEFTWTATEFSASFKIIKLRTLLSFKVMHLLEESWNYAL
jgi:hypothetical protein